MVVFGNIIVEPIWVQGPLAYTPLWAGFTLAPFGVLAVIIFPLVGLYLHIIDVRIWVVLAFIIIAATFFWFSSITIEAPYWQIAMPRLAQGVGFALFFVPLTTLSLAGIPKDKTASAAGLFSFTRMLFISAGVSISVTFWERWTNFFQSRYVEFITPCNPFYAERIKVLESLGIKGDHALQALYQMVQDEASTTSLLELCYGSAWVFIFMLLLLFSFVQKNKRKKGRNYIMRDNRNNSMHEELIHLGMVFAERRKEKHLSLKEIENALSIRISHLQAIEEGEIGKLISPIYAQGFIKKYALF